MGDGKLPCDPMGDGCKALSDAKGELKSEIYTNMNESMEKRDDAMSDFVEKVENAFAVRDTKVDKRLDSQSNRLWWIFGVILVQALSFLAYLGKTVLAGN
jgi:lysozyme family protein